MFTPKKCDGLLKSYYIVLFQSHTHTHIEKLKSRKLWFSSDYLKYDVRLLLFPPANTLHKDSVLTVVQSHSRQKDARWNVRYIPVSERVSVIRKQ